jgi:hypothetical protein
LESTSKNQRKRIENLEIASGQTDDTKQQTKKHEENLVFLKMSEYIRKKMEITMTQEECMQADEDMIKHVVEWYVEYSTLSPEEKEIRDREQEAKDVAKFERDKAFLASEDYKQFEVEYAEFQKKSGNSSIDEEKR